VTHEEVREVIAAYAIDAIDPTERARIDDHLIGCDACRATLREHQEAAGLLAFTAEPATPSRGLRARLLDEVVQSNGSSKTDVQPTPTKSRRGLIVVAATFLVVVLLLFFLPRRGSNTTRVDPEITRVLASESLTARPLLPTRELPDASGQVFQSSGSSVAVFMRGLQDPKGGVYMMWLIVRGQAAPLGTVDVNSAGTAIVLVKKVPKSHEGFLVTLEETEEARVPGRVIILRSVT
jgi:hypothetical protein